jgi:hypothetical protein
MARTAVATWQTTPDCRWSRPATRVVDPDTHALTEPRWICVRAGEPRTVDADDCAPCPYWEARDEEDSLGAGDV